MTIRNKGTHYQSAKDQEAINHAHIDALTINTPPTCPSCDMAIGTKKSIIKNGTIYHARKRCNQ